MTKKTNGRAMQLAGSAKMKDVTAHLPMAHGLLPRHMAMGSWKANLSKGGIKVK